jgi:hypothetical protein
VAKRVRQISSSKPDIGDQKVSNQGQASLAVLACPEDDLLRRPGAMPASGETGAPFGVGARGSGTSLTGPPKRIAHEPPSGPTIVG